MTLSLTIAKCIIVMKHHIYQSTEPPICLHFHLLSIHLAPLWMYQSLPTSIFHPSINTLTVLRGSAGVCLQLPNGGGSEYTL